MVFRKPYAVLIKNFKKIHLVLTGLIIYLIFKTSDVVDFYKDYLNSLVSSENASSYISGLMYIFLLLIIGISIIIYLLMRYKKKPNLLYLLVVVAYIVIFMVFIVTSINLNALERDVFDPKNFRLIRDILRISLALEYILFIPMLIRTLGFDIKKFDFAKDLYELNIDVTDNEEVELVVGVDTEKIKRKGRRKLREFKYYYEENKIFINIILAVIIGVIIIYGILNIKIFNRVYKENEVFSSKNFNIEVEESYLTSKKYDGTDVGYNDTSYIIVKLNINSKYDELTLNPKDFILVIKRKTFLPTRKYYGFFSDLGNGYKNQTFTAGNTKTYLLVYNIEDHYIKERMILRYELDYKNEVRDDLKIRLNPVNLDEKTLVGEYDLKDTINFKDSILNASNFTISDFSIKDSDVYEYEVCSEGECYTKSSIIRSGRDKAILYLGITSSFSDTYIIINNYSLIEYYGKLKYITDSGEKTSTIIDKTPNSAIDVLYLEVNKDISAASKIWLEFSVRGKEYLYYLKGSY